MGLENRDYLRDEARRYGEGGGSFFGGGFGQSREWAIRILVIVNIVIFLLQNVTSEVRGDLIGGVTGWLDLDAQNLVRFQIWRLLTYGFCHADIFHLLFNMLFLWMFGRMVEGIYGSREFLSFFLLGILCSGMGHVLFQVVTRNPAGVIGASGGVFAVTVLAARHFPTTIIRLFLIFPMPLWVAALLFVVLDTIHLMSRESNVAHAAHLAGAAFGYLYYQYQWRVSPFLARLGSPVEEWKRRRRDHQRRKEIQIIRPNDEDLRNEVDRILAKIHEQGEASLSDEERGTLERASRLFRGG